MKRAFTIILIVFILFLTSCTEPSDSPQHSPVATPTANEGNNGNITEPTNDPEVWANAKKLVWICDLRNTYNVDPQIFTEFNNLLLKKGANFIVEFEGIDSSDVIEYHRLIREMKTKGKQVDLLETGFGSSNVDLQTFPEAAKDGLLEPLDAFLKSEYGQKLYNVFDTKAWESVKIDSKIYGINNKANLAYPYFLYINKEVQNKFNIQLPDKINSIIQLEAAYKVIADSQENINGKNAIIPLSNYLPILKGLIGCSYMDSGIAVKYDGNEYPYAFNLLEEPLFNSLLRSAYEYIDKGYIRIDENAYLNINDGMFFATIGGSYPEAYFDGKLALSKIIDVTSYKLSDDFVISQQNGISGIASWSKNKEEAFKLLTMLNTDSDLSNLLRYGILGKQYELVDGKVRQLNAEQRAPGYFSPANQMITHPIGLEPANKAQVYREMQAACKMSPIAGFVLDDSKISDKLSIIKDIYKKYEVLYTGEVEKIEETLAQANQELKDAGIEDVLAEINRQLSSWWETKESGE